MVSPTGSNEARNIDKHGSGAFGAKRGYRLHYGIDLVCIPGQDIYAPHHGKINRVVICYTDTQKYKGLEISGDQIISKILYVIPKPGIIGEQVAAGDVIGYAQRISERYEGITEHVHWEMWQNPILTL